MPRSNRTSPSRPPLRTVLAVAGVMFALLSTAPTAAGSSDRPEPTASAAADVSPGVAEMSPECARSGSPAAPEQVKAGVATKSEASPFDGWLTLLGALIVGVLSLVGVLIASGRTAKSLIAAETTRHKNDLDADRERRRAAVQFDLYVRVAGMMRRLAAICVDIEIGLGIKRIPRSSGDDMVLHIQRKLAESKEPLNEVKAEIEQTLEEVEFLGSEAVHSEITQAYTQAIYLQVFAFNIDAIKNSEERDARLAEVAESIAMCSRSAEQARKLMRAELRSAPGDSAKRPRGS